MVMTNRQADRQAGEGDYEIYLSVANNHSM